MGAQQSLQAFLGSEYRVTQETLINGDDILNVYFPNSDRGELRYNLNTHELMMFFLHEIGAVGKGMEVAKRIQQWATWAFAETPEQQAYWKAVAEYKALYEQYKWESFLVWQSYERPTSQHLKTYFNELIRRLRQKGLKSQAEAYTAKLQVVETYDAMMDKHHTCQGCGHSSGSAPDFERGEIPCSVCHTKSFDTSAWTRDQWKAYHKWFGSEQASTKAGFNKWLRQWCEAHAEPDENPSEDAYRTWMI